MRLVDVLTFVHFPELGSYTCSIGFDLWHLKRDLSSQGSGGLWLIHDLRPTVSELIITDFEEKKNLHDPPGTLETASTCSLHPSSSLLSPTVPPDRRPHAAPLPRPLRPQSPPTRATWPPSRRRARHRRHGGRGRRVLPPLKHRAVQQLAVADIRPDSRSQQPEVWSPLDLYLLSFPIFSLYYYRQNGYWLDIWINILFLDGLCVSSYLCQINITWIINLV
jgi:hypothetical protein